MNPLGHLGLGLLLFAPLAYLLRRHGCTGRLWVGTAGVVVAAAPGLDVPLPAFVAGAPGLAGIGLAALVWASALALSGVPAAFPLGLQVVGTSAAARLLGAAVESLGLTLVYPSYEGGTTLHLLSASGLGVGEALLVCGVVMFWFALGEARIHGPADAGPPPDDGPAGS